MSLSENRFPLFRDMPLRMSLSENRSPLFRDMPFLFAHVLIGQPVPTFPGHAFTLCACPYRKTGSHFSGTCARCQDTASLAAWPGVPGTRCRFDGAAPSSARSSVRALAVMCYRSRTAAQFFIFERSARVVPCSRLNGELRAGVRTRRQIHLRLPVPAGTGAPERYVARRAAYDEDRNCKSSMIRNTTCRAISG
jgi:hypothetical protein